EGNYLVSDAVRGSGPSPAGDFGEAADAVEGFGGVGRLLHGLLVPTLKPWVRAGCRVRLFLTTLPPTFAWKMSGRVISTYKCQWSTRIRAGSRDLPWHP